MLAIAINPIKRFIFCIISTSAEPVEARTSTGSALVLSIYCINPVSIKRSWTSLNESICAWVILPSSSRVASIASRF